VRRGLIGAAQAPGEIVRRRRESGAVRGPLNFTVRRQPCGIGG
jgi:hypothetical protein